MAKKTEAVELKMPATMGACADLLFKTREKRLAIQKDVEALEKQEAAIREHIINNLPKSDGGAVGKLVRVTVVAKAVPQVKDWEAFYGYIRKNASKGGFSLLNKAVNRAAVQEIWDNGKQVPGVESFQSVTLSMNKL